MENASIERRHQPRPKLPPPQPDTMERRGAGLDGDRTLQEAPMNIWQALANAQAMRQSGKL